MNDKKEDHEKFQYKEGGWGWMVVIACSISFGFVIGLQNIYSLLYNEFVQVYNSTENNVLYSAWIGSSAVGIEFFFCIISSMLVDFFDARKIGVIGGLLSCVGLTASSFIKNLRLYFITYSVILAIGQSLLLSALLSILPHYFHKKLGLANGLMTLGSALITITLPFIIAACLQKLNLSNTFFVLTGFSFLTSLCALTFQPQLTANKGESIRDRIKKSLGLTVLKQKKFLIWAFATAIGFFGYLMPILNISHHSITTFPNDSPSIVSAIFGAFSGLSGLISGKLSDILPITTVYFHILSFLLGGIIQFTIPLATQFYQLCVIIGFYGIVDGLFLAFIVPISCEVTNSNTLSNQAIGYFWAFIAIPSIAGPAVAGVIYEKLESYKIAFYAGGGSSLLASFILFLLYPDTLVWKIFKKIKEKNKTASISNDENDNNLSLDMKKF